MNWNIFNRSVFLGVKVHNDELTLVRLSRVAGDWRLMSADGADQLKGQKVVLCATDYLLKQHTVQLPAGLPASDMRSELGVNMNDAWEVTYAVSPKKHSGYIDVHVATFEKSRLFSAMNRVAREGGCVTKVYTQDNQGNVMVFNVALLGKRPRMRRIIYIMGMILMLSLLAGLVITCQTIEGNRQFEKLELDKNALILQQKRLEAERIQQNHYQDQVRHLLQYRTTTEQLFHELGHLPAKNMCFTELAREKNTIMFAGRARSALDLTEFLTNWQTASLFSEIKIIHLRENESNSFVDFRLEAFEKMRSPIDTFESTVPLSGDLQKRLMADIYTWGHLSGVEVQSVHAVHENNLHVIVVGDYFSFSSFVYLLSAQPRLALMTDFIYKQTMRTKFKADLHIKIWPGGMKPVVLSNAMKNIPAIRNPFCIAEDVNISAPQNDLSYLQSFSLQTMKMVGYLHQAERVYAMIALPNGTVVDVAPGFVLGVEKGTVVLIQPDHLVLALPNKTQWILKV